MHTLTEHHDHLLSTSFDLSFHGSADPGADPSSSQAGAFGFHDDMFLGDGIDLGDDFGAGIGDDLARELGEGWGVPLADNVLE